MAEERRSLLDELMPCWQFGERHEIPVDAAPERALEAVERVTPGEMPLVRLLFAVRSVPARVRGKRGLPARKNEPLLQQMLDFGFVLLAEETHREVVFGGVGQMFEPSGGVTPTIRSAREFLAFEEPGYAKVAMNFRVGLADVDNRMSTETRVLTTDSRARQKFGRYWLVIRPGSAAIRRSWLRAAKRRAECGSINARP